MSGPGRPTLDKPEHASRARPLCARDAINPDLLEPALRVNSKTSGGKGGNLESLGNSGLFDDGATLRKPAETGGNPLQRLCSRNCPQFCCLTQGVQSSP
jgi:hypothetical protein